MQPIESYSVPRRALDVEDYIDVLRRHKGWIFGPFLLTLVASVVGVYVWPDSYDSAAVVSIKPQQVPEQMVRAAVNQDMVDRINALSQQVLSRNELTNLIRNLNLYQRERNRMPLEDVLEIMRKSIHLTPMNPIVGSRNVPAFQVSFSYNNRFDAQKVVSSLVSKFIDENIKTRDRATYQTEDFLRGQTENAKKRLDDIDQKITEFRLAHPGALPDQLQSSLTQMNAVQTNMLAMSNAVSRSSAEKMQLETQLRVFRDQVVALNRDSKVVAAKAVPQKSQKVLEAERQLEQLELQLASLRKQFTENYPQVRQMKGYVDTARQHLDQVRADDEAAKQVAGSAPEDPTANIQAQREIRNYEGAIVQIESQIKAKDLEVAGLERQVKQMTDQLTMLNARVQAMPVGDQAFNDLIREQNLAKEEYMKMNQNLTAARVAVDMEGRKQGETLELLDSATLPVDPTAPNRPMVISVGAGLGLVLGIVLAGAREMKDTSLKNLKDVRAYTQLAILGSVPLLENDFVVRRRRRIAWLGWTVACLTAALVMAGSIVYYYATKA